MRWSPTSHSRPSRRDSIRSKCSSASASATCSDLAAAVTLRVEEAQHRRLERVRHEDEEAVVVGTLFRGEPRLGVAVTEVEQDRCRFGENEVAVDERRDDTERVQRAVGGIVLRLVALEQDELVVDPDLGERRVRRHRSGAGAPVEAEGLHGATLAGRAPPTSSNRIDTRRDGEFADEIASAVVWLLGDKASHGTGSILDIAGGR